jgi:hypothetical protein
MVTLLQVPDGVTAAYESQSEEEEMDEICGTLRCLQPYIMVTLLQVPDGVTRAYESQSEEEEMYKICGALRCLQPVYIGDTVAGA